jgi:hypothetical protein
MIFSLIHDCVVWVLLAVRLALLYPNCVEGFIQPHALLLLFFFKLAVGLLRQHVNK